MPRLSQQTLEKRFLCTHYAKTFRTRQGLSGHIQYKHPSGAPANDNSYVQAVLDAFKFKQTAEIAGFNKEDISQIWQIVARWEPIKGLFENEHTKFNDTDLKTYLIVSLARMQANQQLFDKLQQQLGTAIAEPMKIQSEIDAGIFERSLQSYSAK